MGTGTFRRESRDVFDFLIFFLPIHSFFLFFVIALSEFRVFLYFFLLFFFVRPWGPHLSFHSFFLAREGERPEFSKKKKTKSREKTMPLFRQRGAGFGAAPSASAAFVDVDAPPPPPLLQNHTASLEGLLEAVPSSKNPGKIESVSLSASGLCRCGARGEELHSVQVRETREEKRIGAFACSFVENDARFLFSFRIRFFSLPLFLTFTLAKKIHRSSSERGRTTQESWTCRACRWTGRGSSRGRRARRRGWPR